MKFKFASAFFVCMALVTMLASGCDRKAEQAGPTTTADSPSNSAPPPITTTAKPGEDERCSHEIRQDKCPFCNPGLIQSDGFCGEHGVAEALCYLCRPYLKAAFRAQGDWCADHKAPKSQCTVCDPELLKNAKPGSGHGA